MSGLDPWLAEPLATIALCWRVERRDGVTVGLTAHDRDLVVDGVPYRAAPGITPSAVSLNDGLEPGTMDVTGALTHAGVAEHDLIAGRWDGAGVILLAVDWTDPERRRELARGTVGAVEMRNGQFTAELLGPAARCDRPVAEETSPECRAELGDHRCRVPMAGRRRFARIVTANGATLTLDRAEPRAGAYAGGQLRWFGGANGGSRADIAASAGTGVTLRSAPPFPGAGGDLVELIEGCDKSLATCAARFGNAVNFRGEPYLPGMDLLTRYPGA